MEKKLEKYIIIHNPRCSKSRETLTILESHGVNLEIIDYLGGGLSRELLKKVVDCLEDDPRTLVRTKEVEFADLNVDLDDSKQIIETILIQPKLLERPIVIKGDKVIIGRPPENVLKLLK